MVSKLALLALTLGALHSPAGIAAQEGERTPVRQSALTHERVP